MKIHSSPARNIVVKAGKRFGKTKLATYKIVKWAFEEPGMYWYIAPTYRQAKNIAWREFNTLIPPSLIKRRLENELLLELVGGIPLQLIGADNEDSLRGPKLKGVVLDECAYLKRYIWPNIIRGQLLGANGEAPGHALFISSPINPLETIGKDKTDWYKNFFDSAMQKKLAGDKDWDAFHFSIYDNPTLAKDQIDQMRADASEDEWNVEYMAEDSALGGTLFSEFNYQQHVMPCTPGDSAVLVRGHDWGMDHPTVCLLVYVDVPNKRVYVEDEYVKSGLIIEEHCATIAKMTNSRPVAWDVCDPSMNKRNSQTKRTDKDEYARSGIFCVGGDNNNRGYNITKMMLKKDVLRIHPRCKTLIKQLKDLQYADTVGDDCVDVLRYVCVRIHDFMFKWTEAKTKEEPQKAGTFSLNDRNLFPSKPFQSTAFRQEVNTF